jgi:hypothetical protein
MLALFAAQIGIGSIELKNGEWHSKRYPANQVPAVNVLEPRWSRQTLPATRAMRR